MSRKVASTELRPFLLNHERVSDRADTLSMSTTLRATVQPPNSGKHIDMIDFYLETPHPWNVFVPVTFFFVAKGFKVELWAVFSCLVLWAVFSLTSALSSLICTFAGGWPQLHCRIYPSLGLFAISLLLDLNYASLAGIFQKWCGFLHPTKWWPTLSYPFPTV